jgi:hypothetical protein
MTPPNKINDGGPASQKTLRDWFAGKAMEAMITKLDEYDEEVTADLAYEMADAMLERRKIL